MKRTTEILTGFDYKNGNYFELEETLKKEINGLPVIEYCIPKEKAIYRCRRNVNFKDLFFFENDISYRTDVKNIRTAGRCHLPASSIFYGSVSTLTNDGRYFDGYITSIYETSSLITDDLNGMESYTIGMWVAKENIYLPLVIPEKDYFIKLGVDEGFYKSFEPHINKLFQDTDVAELYKVFGNEFKKKVHSANHYEYFVSALICESLIKVPGGIMYPSVKAEGIGMNVAFLPNKFDELFELKQVGTGELYKFKDQIVFNHRLIVEDVKVYPFKYKPVPNGISKSDQEIISFFNSIGIDNEFMVKGLFESIRRN